MARHIFRMLIVTVLLLVPTAARAQVEELTVYLANGATQAIDVDTARYRVVLKSFLPFATYTITIGPAVPTLLPPLSREVVPAADAPCDALRDLRSKAITQSSEEEMAGLVAQLSAVLSKCNALEQEEFRQATRRADEQNFDMPRGTTRTVVIRRLKANDKVGERVFTITLKAPERGRWLTTYGVGFTPDRNDRFFLKSAGENTFTVTPQQEHKDQLNYIPAVFFTWLGADRQLRSVSHGWTAGLGFESERPAIFGGYQWSWNQNLGVMVGVAAHQHKRLNGRHKSSDTVTETLTDDQLHESIWAPNAVISLTFRLGSNPFAAEPKAAKPDTEADKKEAAEKEAAKKKDAAKKESKHP